MPYKSRSIRIEHTKFDRRIKLSNNNKLEIKYLHKNGMSQRQLAKRFKVSRRLISFILDPEKARVNRLQREARGGTKQYYDKDKHREYMKTHRNYKQKLYVDGLIKL